MKYNSDIYNARNAIDRIEKQTLNEKPYGFLDRMKDAAVTAFGSDAASAQAQGSAITKKRATDLYNAMKMWVGRKQLNPKNLTLDEISSFLKEFGFKDPTIQDAANKSGIKSGVAAQGKQIDQMMINIASNIGADGQMPGTKGAGAPNAGAKQPAQQSAPKMNFPKSVDGVQLKPGDKVTYVNAKGKTQQSVVNSMLQTTDKQGDLQIQLKTGNATFAVDRQNIKSANGKPWAFDPATGKGKGSTPKANANQLIKSIQGMDKANQDALLKILQQSMKTQGA